MATTLITRETAGAGATIKNAPLTNAEVDNNFISLADNKVEIIDGTVAVIPTGTTAERPGTPSTGMLRFNTTEEAFEGYNGIEWTSIGGGGVSYTLHTSNYTAEAGEGVLADTSGGSFTVTLPASPDIGDTVVVADTAGSWDTNNLTIDRNGSTIEDESNNFIASISNLNYTFVYNGTTWNIYTAINNIDSDVVTANSLSNTLETVATTGDYGDLFNTPNLSSVATSGSYTDLSNTPTITTFGQSLIDDADDSTARGTLGLGTVATQDSSDVTLSGDFDSTGSYTSNVNQLSDSSIDCSIGNYFTDSVSSNISYSFNNAPSNKAYAFTLEVDYSSGTITWPNSVEWPGNQAPALESNRVNLFVFVTTNGGTVWHGSALANYPN